MEAVVFEVETAAIEYMELERDGPPTFWPPALIEICKSWRDLKKIAEEKFEKQIEGPQSMGE